MLGGKGLHVVPQTNVIGWVVSSGGWLPLECAVCGGEAGLLEPFVALLRPPDRPLRYWVDRLPLLLLFPVAGRTWRLASCSLGGVCGLDDRLPSLGREGGTGGSALWPTRPLALSVFDTRDLLPVGLV